MEPVVKKEAPSKALPPKQSIQTSPARPSAVKKPAVKPALPRATALNKEKFTDMGAAATVHEIKLAAQRELEIARRMRGDAARYQQQMATRARSDAQQLMLRVRLQTQRETEELVRQANEEIQKVLADIRMIRIMAQEELAAQRKFTDAARLRSMSLGVTGEDTAPDTRKRKSLAAVK